MAKYLIGIDNGTTMVKAAIFDTAGNELSAAGRKVKHDFPRPDWVETDMNVLWDDSATVVQEALQKAAVAPHDIACVACTGHGNGLYLTDSVGNPVRPAIRSPDTRARGYIEQWQQDDTLGRIIHKTTQSIWPLQPNALLRWMRDHEPEVLARASHFFCVKDYIRFRLTGEAAMERTDMSGCSLINVVTGEYDDEVLDAWGIADCRRLFPPLKGSADLCGRVTREAAAKTGLIEGTPVAGGMFDIDACGLACGMTNETELCMVAGTWGNNQYIAREPVVDRGLFMSSCYSIPGYYLMLEGSSTSASNLEWFVSEFMEADRMRLEAANDTKTVFDLCGDLVAATSPEDAGLIFLPFLFGSNVSLDGKGVFFGLDGRQTRGHVLRAVFEGIVFAHAWHVRRLLQFRPMPEHIRLTGGAARSHVWARMFADVLQTPVEIPAGTELGALGAAIAAAVAVGIHDSFEAACQAMVRMARVYKPDPDLAEIYSRKYARYLRLLEVLGPAWGELAW